MSTTQLAYADTLPVAYEVRTAKGHTLARSNDWDSAVSDLHLYDGVGERVEIAEVRLHPVQGWVRRHAWGWTL